MRRSRLWLVLLLASLGAAFAVGATSAVLYLSGDHVAEFATRGALEEAVVTERLELETREILYATLTTRAGIAVRMAVSVPNEPSPLPNVVTAAGYRTGREAVRLLPDDLPVVFAAIDYPYDGPERFGDWDWIPELPRLRRAALDTPPALLAVAEFVRSLPGAHPDHTILMGVSFGGPFALAALAADPDLDGLVYAYAGGDISLWAEHSFRNRPLRLLHRTGARLLAFLCAPLEPSRHAPGVGLRPVLLVSGTEDDTVNPESLGPLLASLEAPPRHVWLEGSHIGAERAEIIEELLSVALDWTALKFPLTEEVAPAATSSPASG